MARKSASLAVLSLLQLTSRLRCSYRKELKIRPGYTPEEDVKRYRSQRQAEEDARASTKGKVPGLVPSAAQAAIAGMSKAQKKNAKRKEKRRDEAEEEEEEDRGVKKVAEVEEVPEDWDDEGELPPPVPAPAAPAPAPVDEEKRVKALKKKLRQVRFGSAFGARCFRSWADSLHAFFLSPLFLPPSSSTCPLNLCFHCSG